MQVVSGDVIGLRSHFRVIFFRSRLLDSSDTRDRPRSWPASGSRITWRDSAGPGWIAGVGVPARG